MFWRGAVGELHARPFQPCVPRDLFERAGASKLPIDTVLGQSQLKPEGRAPSRGMSGQYMLSQYLGGNFDPTVRVLGEELYEAEPHGFRVLIERSKPVCRLRIEVRLVP